MYIHRHKRNWAAKERTCARFWRLAVAGRKVIVTVYGYDDIEEEQRVCRYARAAIVDCKGKAGESRQSVRAWLSRWEGKRAHDVRM